MNGCRLSIVIPIYNEFESLLPLCNSISKVMHNREESYEIIFVNDGSIGAEIDYLELGVDKNTVKIIDLPMHIGQMGALAAGFKEAKGELVISMDGDLQDNPEYIPLFIDTLNKGFDIVCGYRFARKERRIRIVLSRIGNFLQRVILKTNIHDISCTYRIYNVECVRGLSNMRSGYYSYIPFILLRRGYKITEVPIEQGGRIFGHSKYNIFWQMSQNVVSLFFLIYDILRKTI